jgi:hypothetical protein
LELLADQVAQNALKDCKPQVNCIEDAPLLKNREVFCDIALGTRKHS